MKTKICTIFLCFGLVCCATAPAPRQIQSSFPVDKPFDPVWQAVIEVFAELNLSIMNLEKASGLITTEWISFRGQSNSGYCDCGGLGLNVELDRRGKFNVYVKKISDNSCEIKVNAVFDHIIRSALDQTSPQLINTCVSTGKMEAEFYKRFMEKIK